jgi:uncharacterized protein (DUF433 family)
MSTLTLNEAAVIVDVDADVLRADIKREIITPLRAAIGGRDRPVFAWEDLGCLATLYDARNAELMAPDVRRRTFSIYRTRLSQAEAANWHEAAEKIRDQLAVVMTRPARRGSRDTGRSHAMAISELTLNAEGAAERWMLHLDAFLSVDIKPAVDRIDHTAALYARGLERVVSDPDRMGGAPVFAGTRLPVRHIGLMCERGAPPAEVLEDYPELTADDLEFARLYAKANPVIGRPARSEALTGE